MKIKRALKPIFKATNALLMASLFLGTSLYSVTAGEVHTVEKGETLYNIAKQYGTTVETLMALNGLSDYSIDSGTQLVVAGDSVDNGYEYEEEGSSYTSTYVVQPGDYLTKIANQFGMSVHELKNLNGLTSDFIDVGDLLAITSDGLTSVTPPPYGSSGAGYTWNNDYSYSTGSSAGTYKVQAGDNVWEIALAYGITEEQLMAYNGLASKWIYPGDLLYIPGTGSTTSQGYIPYTPTYTDSFAYTVQPGDNTWDIAVAYGLTEEYLMAYNGMTSKLIYPGEVLYIPGAASSAPVSGPVQSEPVESSPTTPTTPVVPTTPSESVPESTAESTPESTESNTPRVRSPRQVQGADNRELADPATPAVDSEEINLELHEVAEGEALADIAQTYNITGAEIREWNQLLNDDIQEGDILYVTDPVNAVTAFKQLRPLTDVYPLEYLPSRGEELENAFEMFNVTEENILEWNELSSTEEFAAGEPFIVTHPEITPAVYEVQEGDSIASVAEATGVSVESIRAWNGLLDNIIYIGEELAVTNPFPTLHEVNPPETLEDIAQQYNVTVEDIRNWNNLPEESLFVGGTLIVSDPTADVETQNDRMPENESTTEETEDTDSANDETTENTTEENEE